MKNIIIYMLLTTSLCFATELNKFDNSFPPNSSFGLVLAPKNVCGGVYIANNIILSAKDCLQDPLSKQTYQPNMVVFNAGYQSKFSMFKVNLNAIIFSRIPEKNTAEKNQLAYALLIISPSIKNNAGYTSLYEKPLKNNTPVEKISFYKDYFISSKCIIINKNESPKSKLKCSNSSKAGDIIMFNGQIAGVVLNNKNDVINSSFIIKNPYLIKMNSQK